MRSFPGARDDVKQILEKGSEKTYMFLSILLEVFRNQTFRKTRIKVVSISFPFILVKEKEIFSISCYKLTMENACANLLTTNFM